MTWAGPRAPGICRCHPHFLNSAVVTTSSIPLPPPYVPGVHKRWGKWSGGGGKKVATGGWMATWGDCLTCTNGWAGIVSDTPFYINIVLVLCIIFILTVFSKHLKKRLQQTVKIIPLKSLYGVGLRIWLVLSYRLRWIWSCCQWMSKTFQFWSCILSLARENAGKV